jgi:hypothetical protein
VTAGTAPRLLLLTVVLQACDLYRQRFFLDRRSEMGIHWRGKLLKFVKWPYILIGLYEALFRPASGYAMTRKDRITTRAHLLARAYLPVIGLTALAWLLGLLLGATQNFLLLLIAAGVSLVAVAAIGTEFLRFPDPYDARLAKEKLGSPERVSARPTQLSTAASDARH